MCPDTDLLACVLPAQTDKRIGLPILESEAFSPSAVVGPISQGEFLQCSRQVLKLAGTSLVLCIEQKVLGLGLHNKRLVYEVLIVS